MFLTPLQNRFIYIENAVILCFLTTNLDGDRVRPRRRRSGVQSVAIRQRIRQRSSWRQHHSAKRQLGVDDLMGTESKSCGWKYRQQLYGGVHISVGGQKLSLDSNRKRGPD